MCDDSGRHLRGQCYRFHGVRGLLYNFDDVVVLRSHLAASSDRPQEHPSRAVLDADLGGVSSLWHGLRIHPDLQCYLCMYTDALQVSGTTADPSLSDVPLRLSHNRSNHELRMRDERRPDSTTNDLVSMEAEARI